MHFSSGSFEWIPPCWASFHVHVFEAHVRVGDVILFVCPHFSHPHSHPLLKFFSDCRLCTDIFLISLYFPLFAGDCAQVSAISRSLHLFITQPCAAFPWIIFWTTYSYITHQNMLSSLPSDTMHLHFSTFTMSFLCTKKINFREKYEATNLRWGTEISFAKVTQNTCYEEQFLITESIRKGRGFLKLLIIRPSR